MWLETKTGEVLCRWLSKVWTNKRSGIAKIRIDEDLAPYLFDLKEKLTQYQLYNVLAMKSAFSVHMYKLLKSYAFQKYKVFDLDELKRLLMINNVKSYTRFEPITKGRKVVKIKFIIRKKDIAGCMASEQTTHNYLGSLE